MRWTLYNGVSILSINYLKTNLLSLLKTIIYSIVLKYYRVKSSNTVVVEYNLKSNIELIRKGLEILNLNHLLELIDKFYEYVEIKLKP